MRSENRQHCNIDHQFILHHLQNYSIVGTVNDKIVNDIILGFLNNYNSGNSLVHKLTVIKYLKKIPVCVLLYYFDVIIWGYDTKTNKYSYKVLTRNVFNNKITSN